MKILLAVDSSPLSEAIVLEMIEGSWPPATEVCVVTVIDLFGMMATVGYLTPIAENESRAAETFVNKVADRLASKGLKTSFRVIEGNPSGAIVDFAAEWGADLIALGSHGHSGLVSFFIGSVARGVLHNARCSVRIVRPPEVADRAGRPMKILLATDGSEYSLAAARSFAKRTLPQNTEVAIVSVAEVFVPATDPWYGAGEMADQIREASVGQALSAVAATEDIIRAAGFEVSGRVVVGHPKAKILEEAVEAGADLIVLGSHGKRGLSRILVGSVSEAVAMRANCSVEVVRAPEPEKR